MSATPLPSSAAPSDSKHPEPSQRSRLVKRRGRGRGGFESDEELQREVGTDPESDDDHSSVASTVDSDTPPASSAEDYSSNGHSRILTPNTTQSSTGVKSFRHSGSHSSTKSTRQDTAFFDNAIWSDMVAEEAVNGPSDLPVVNFEDFNTSSPDQRSIHTPSRKAGKRPPVKRAVSAPNVDRPAASEPFPPAQTDPKEEGEPATGERSASTSRQTTDGLPRRPGQSARLAYQQRLESDPSFVPTVGEFWGHDDRLLDKNWRSLSGWWRGRWQGRGRGRGMDRGVLRGRGGGGAATRLNSDQRGSAEGNSDPQEVQKSSPEVPRIDQPWVHDGYEEMKKRDERRRANQQQQQVARSSGGISPRGRGAYGSARGRGGVARVAAFTSPPTRSTFVPPLSTPDRTWYAMKPECAWTKQHDAFLYFDTALKPRPGVGPGYRVRLPSTELQVVRGSVRASPSSATGASSSLRSRSSESGDRAFIVQLPKPSGGEPASRPPSSTPQAEPSTTVEELPVEDVFVVRPGLAPPQIPIVGPTPPVVEHTPAVPTVSLSAGPPSQSPLPAVPVSPTPSVAASTVPSQPQEPGAQPAQPVVQVQSVESADPGHGANESSTAEENQVAEPQEAAPQRTMAPAPPSLQTVFPPPHASPSYSPHYGYNSPLPHGIAVNQHGMPYEVATGRPVYLQPPVYTPRPLAHGMMTPPGMYMPGHMHHHSGSPDFLAPSHTPPIPGFLDPATGGPLFVFPRQSARVEIRPPSSKPESKSDKSQRPPSGLRTSTATYGASEPASPVNDAEGFAAPDGSYPAPNGVDVLGAASNGAGSEQLMDPAVHGYAAYHQQYYYPEQYGYYYDVPSCEMYAPQGVYY